MSDKWADEVRLASVVVPADTFSGDWDLERAILARERFEAEHEIGRLMAISRRVERLDNIGVPPALDMLDLDLHDQILASRRTAEVVKQLRRIAWLLAAILAVALWFAWRAA